MFAWWAVHGSDFGPAYYEPDLQADFGSIF